MATISHEIEAKMRVADHAALRDRLRAAGGRFVSRGEELNRFFDRPDESLRRAGCGLRVRQIRTLEGEPTPATITYKGPLEPGALKIRPECELVVADAEQAAKLLAQLGYRETFSFEKRRETWRLGDCTVELDELPLIGRFVEIEGPDGTVVEAARSRIGLASEPLERESYLGLLARASMVRGAMPARVSFA